jgi:hypothetical protein
MSHFEKGEKSILSNNINPLKHLIVAIPREGLEKTDCLRIEADANRIILIVHILEVAIIAHNFTFICSSTNLILRFKVFLTVGIDHNRRFYR